MYSISVKFSKNDIDVAAGIIERIVSGGERVRAVAIRQIPASMGYEDIFTMDISQGKKEDIAISLRERFQSEENRKIASDLRSLLEWPDTLLNELEGSSVFSFDDTGKIKTKMMEFLKNEIKGETASKWLDVLKQDDEDSKACAALFGNLLKHIEY